ncbi:MAG: tyrosine-type recombinase/integrase [Gammaproteobacteria bacterium]
MGRQLRDPRIETREARLKLKQRHEPYWRLIHPGCHLGYRKGVLGGVWMLRRLKSDSRYTKMVLGDADDMTDSDGIIILSFKGSLQKAFGIIESSNPCQKNLTVNYAVNHYLIWYKQNRKAYTETASCIEAHIRPLLGTKLIADLTTREIKLWHQKLAEQPARKRSSSFGGQQFKLLPQTDDQKRSRRNTANRILTVLKAILNKAFQEEYVNSDLAWKRVKPFANVDEPVIRFLNQNECVRLINACQIDLRNLVKGALYSGCRYGELAKLQVKDISITQASVYIQPSKSNKGRHVPLTVEGLSLFKSLIIGKLGDQYVFTKLDNKPWGKNHYTRLLKDACEAAKILPAISFHELRHTYASFLAQKGADLLTISKLLGHADTRVTSRHYAHLCDRTLANAVNSLLPNFLSLEKTNMVHVTADLYV